MKEEKTERSLMVRRAATAAVVATFITVGTATTALAATESGAATPQIPCLGPASAAAHVDGKVLTRITPATIRPLDCKNDGCSNNSC